MVKVMVNVECPLCGFFKCLGSVQVDSVEESLAGENVPFRVDYRVWSGGRARGVTQKQILRPGKIPPQLEQQWLAFVDKISEAFHAVEAKIYSTPRMTKILRPGRLTVIFGTPRLSR